MATTASIGHIETISGIVKAITEAGVERYLKVGDSIMMNEVIETVGSDGDPIRLHVKFDHGGSYSLSHNITTLMDESVYKKSKEVFEEQEEIDFDALDETAAGSGLATLALLPAQFLDPVDIFKMALSSGALNGMIASKLGMGEDSAAVSFAGNLLNGSATGNDLIPVLEQFFGDEKSIYEVKTEITSNRGEILYGHVPSDSVVTVLDNGAILGTVTAEFNGSWVIKPENLNEGDHHFTIEVVTPDGETLSATGDLRVDTTPPIADATVDDVLTKQGQPAISGKLPSDFDIGDRVDVEIGGRYYATDVKAFEGTWSVPVGAITYLDSGAYDVVLHLTDAAGNRISLFNEGAVVIDKEAPVLSVDDAIVTDDVTPNFKGTAEAGNEIFIQNGDRILVQTTADETGAWSLELGVQLDGVYNFKINAKDAAGNKASVTKAVVIDTTPPEFNEATVNLGTIGTGESIAPSGISEADTQVSITLTDTTGATISSSVISDANGNWTFETIDLASFADGEIEVAFLAVDQNGNSVPSSSDFNFTKDILPPEVTVNMDTILAGTTQPEISGTVSSNEALKYLRIEVDGQGFTGINIDESGNWKLEKGFLEPLEEGEFDISVIAYDKAGNASQSQTFENILKVDGTIKSGTDSDDQLVFTNANESIYGLDGDDQLFAKGGDDHLDGGSGKDHLLAGDGDDTLVYDSSDKEVNGGTGYDTLLVNDASELRFDQTLSRIEEIRLNGDDTQNFTLTLNDVLNVTSESANSTLLFSSTGSDDTLTLSGDWSAGASDSNTYNTFINGTTSINVSTDLTVSFDDQGNSI
jgi:hypothetical protein